MVRSDGACSESCKRGKAPVKGPETTFDDSTLFSELEELFGEQDTPPINKVVSNKVFNNLLRVIY